MRYIKQKIMHVTEFDGIITDEEEIITLVENISKINVDIQLNYREEKLDMMKSLKKCRIIKINKENKTVDLRAFFGNSSSLLNNIKIKDIDYIKVLTERSIISPNENLSNFIDIGEVEKC
jgi:hypothetical protein